MPKETVGLTSIVPVGELATTQAVDGKIASTQIPSPVLDTYSTGKGFKIDDNTQLYEIVKCIRDIIDFNFYNMGMTTLSMAFGINVNAHEVVFTITFNDNQAVGDLDVSNQPVEFAEKLCEIIKMKISQKFFDTVDMEKQIRPLTGDAGFSDCKTEIKLTIREKISKEI